MKNFFCLAGAMLFVACALTTIAAPQSARAQIRISEIRLDQPGPDVDEYLELVGPPADGLDDLWYIVIGDGTGGSGVIEMEQPLRELVIPHDGFALLAESSFSLGPEPDLVVSLNFENGDNVTHLIVSGFSGSVGLDLDSDDDGALDHRPWTAIHDCVAILDSSTSGDATYCDATIGPDGGSAPFHVFRDSGWHIGPREPTPGLDTPGAAPPDLPVESVRFEGFVESGVLLLRWTILGQPDFGSFRVIRRTDGAWDTVGTLGVVTNAQAEQSYELAVYDLAGTQEFELLAVLSDGTEECLGRILVEIPVGGAIRLAAPSPNPTTGPFSVRAYVGREDVIDVSIFDASGRRIRNLYSGQVSAATATELVARVDDLPTGVYFVVAAGSRSRAVKSVVKW